MKVIDIFCIASNSAIEILEPSFKDKFNYYSEPAAGLSLFDEVTLLFKEKNKEIILSNDMIIMIVDIFKSDLKKASNNEIVLPSTINIGTLGYYHMVHTMADDTNMVVSLPSSLWSGENIETWLYNKNDKIYLEISSIYPWLYSDLEEAKLDPKFITFDEFMKTYKPIFVSEITREIAEKWLVQCDAILNSMIKCG